jgi:hypothetical protein
LTGKSHDFSLHVVFTRSRRQWQELWAVRLATPSYVPYRWRAFFCVSKRGVEKWDVSSHYAVEAYFPKYSYGIGEVQFLTISLWVWRRDHFCVQKRVDNKAGRSDFYK